jgi:hypothetical protein
MSPKLPWVKRLAPMPWLCSEVVKPLGVGPSGKSSGYCNCAFEGNVGTPALSFSPLVSVNMR